jgi:hypothetical protein
LIADATRIGESLSARAELRRATQGLKPVRR